VVLKRQSTNRAGIIVSFKSRFWLAQAAICAALCGAAKAQIPDVPGWQLFWHDEFDGSSLNTAEWAPMDRQDSFNSEKQYYRPEQVTVSNGNLVITATNQQLANKPYRSGLITSKDLFGQGRFEARMDLPTTQGMWPAFWMNPNQVQWPLGGEIDILENRGSQPTLTSSAFHWQKNAGPCCGQHQYVFEEYTATEGGQPVNFHAGFHTYAAEWDKAPGTNTNQIRFYVDGNLHFAVTQNPTTMSDANFTTAKNIILNLAVGGDFGGDPNGTTVFPQTLLVDYVRVWHRPTGVTGDYNADGQVNATDYVVWRNNEGQSGIGLAGDGSGNGTVGAEDFDIWRQSHASAAGLGAAASVTGGVPEPSAAVPMAVSLLLLYSQRIRF
jgi:beta-glucanase (GH16 family)